MAQVTIFHPIGAIIVKCEARGLHGHAFLGEIIQGAFQETQQHLMIINGIRMLQD